MVPDIISWHSLPGDPVANVAAANATLNSRGIAHPWPYQINEYGASTEQNPADGALVHRPPGAGGADGLRANWAGGGNLHNDLGNLLVRNSSGQYQPKGDGGSTASTARRPARSSRSPRSSNYDAFATKASGTAKILVGGGTTTGNVAVNLQRLDTTSGIVQNNQVRVVAERIPSNGGGAVTAPVTVQNSVVTLSGNATTVNLPHNSIDDTYTITLLPPSTDPGNGSSTSVLRNVNANRCLDVPGVSTTNGTQLNLWDCGTGSNQQWTSTSSKQLQVYGNKCLDALRGRHRQRHLGDHLGLQRPGQPAVEPQLRRHRHRRPVRQVPGGEQLRHRERHQGPAVVLHRHEQPEVDQELTG